MFTVYLHKFPNGKVYVGITSKKCAKKRWSNGNGYKTQQLMWRAIQKYGWNNIEHTIVAENLSKEDACQMEMSLIEKYQSNNPKYGYNIYCGGNTGRLGISFSDEEKQRLSSSTKGRPKTVEEVVKIKRTLAEYWTAERREQFGKLHGGQGHKLNEEEAICIYNKLCDGVDRKELAQEYGVSKSAIDRIANKQYWSIRDSDNCILNRTLPEKYIYQYDLQDRFIRCWRTFDDIHNELCINVGTVCECCNHKREKTKGYKWKYVLILDNGKEIVL